MPPLAQRILLAVREAGSADLVELADRLNMGGHELLDHAEGLFIGGLLTTDTGGKTLRSTE
jgi:hypothetical protein